MKNISLFMFLLLGLLTANTCNQDNFMKDMVQLDKALIPTLYYVWEGDMYNAKRSVFYLDFKWQKFKNKYELTAQKDKKWQESLRRTGDCLQHSYQSIDANRAELASVYLDRANYELRDLRRRFSMEYYPDKIYDFEEALLDMQEIAEDNMLCLLEWNEFEPIYHKVLAEWHVLKQADFERDVYLLSYQQEKEIHNKVKILNEDMKKMSTAMDCADQHLVQQAVNQTARDVMGLLTSFGNFEHSKPYYAKFFN